MGIDLKKFAADPLEFFDALVIPSAHGPRRFKDCMADFQREWFQATAPSLIALSKGERPPIGRFWTERSKGGSKDTDAACVLLWLLAFSRSKLDMQVGASDRDQALELKKAAADILRLNEWLAVRIEVQVWTLLCKATGSECAIISSDIASSHGARPDVVCLNELSHITKEEFAQNLLDNASKKPDGLVIVATNAGFNPSWQYNWRETFRQSDRWHFHQLAQPSPWLRDEEIEEAERRNSRSRFNRLYWGQWVSASGDALDQQDIDACTDGSLGPMGKVKGWIYCGGLDLSVSQDHSALVVVAANRSTQQLQLAYAESWKPDPQTRKVDLVQVERTILATHQRYDLEILGCDPFQAQLMMQRLSLQKVPVKEVPFVGKALNEMASVLLDVFRSRRIRLYNHRALIADLQRLTIEERSYGYRLAAARTTRGEGTVHADLAVALSIALPLAVEEAGHVPIVIHSMLDGDGDNPFLQWTRRQQQYQEETEYLSRGDPSSDPWRKAMRLVGRTAPPVCDLEENEPCP